jgi:hypothetical protein
MKEPAIPEEIVKYLEDVFPMQDFNTDTDFRRLDFHYGQRSVVRFLRSKLYEQNENILNPKLRE